MGDFLGGGFGIINVTIRAQARLSMEITWAYSTLAAWANFPATSTQFLIRDGRRHGTIAATALLASRTCSYTTQTTTVAATGAARNACGTVIMLATIAVSSIIWVGDITTVIAGYSLPFIETDIGTVAVVGSQHRSHD